MSILDLLGVIAIGLLGAISVTGLGSKEPNSQVNEILRILQISNLDFKSQVILLGIGSVILLVGRTLLSIISTRRILFFLSRRGAKLSADLVSRLLAQPLSLLQARTKQELLFSTTRGVEFIVLQVIAPFIVLVADVSLLLILILMLFVVEPLTAIVGLLLFSLVAYFLYRFMHVRAESLGVRNSELNVKSNEKIIEVFDSYRESVVRNRRNYYSQEIRKMRFDLADTSAEIGFMPFVSKYVIESSVILGALLVAAAQFMLQDSVRAVSVLAIFLAAGTRIAPSALRVQQGLILIRNSLGSSTLTLDLIDSLDNVSLDDDIGDSLDLTHEGFFPRIQVSGVSLSYPDMKLPAIANINLDIQAGSFIALVGPSGAGKTTLIDVLLGVLQPDTGEVLISGLSPLLAFSKWPGAVSYVPQDVAIVAGTIRQNVALGYPSEFVTDELIMRALRISGLDDFVQGLPDGLNTEVGERGTRISGGQRQRLGIARAMFTCPRLLVLDEATSSLDSESELGISRAIELLRGETTVIMIAHRLSTVRNADSVIYLSEGSILALGTFDVVRNAVSSFDRQAKLMGL
jgi:ABC-type multidrug transport system fused ATPase/permease subunit